MDNSTAAVYAAQLRNRGGICYPMTKVQLFWDVTIILVVVVLFAKTLYRNND